MSSLCCMECKTQCILRARPENEDLFGAPCDLCKMVFCRNCSGIGATEVRAVALTQRVLLFFCPGCRNIVKDLSRDKKALEDRLRIINSESQSKNLTIERLEQEHQTARVNLENEIERLLMEIKERDSHIGRLHRRSNDFGEDVISAEKGFVAKINEQNKEITKVNKEIVLLIKRNNLLTEQITELKTNYDIQTQKLAELNALRNNLMTSIETLSAENDLHVKDLKKANMDLFVLKEEQKIDKKSIQVQTDGLFNGVTLAATQELLQQDIQDSTLLFESAKEVTSDLSMVTGRKLFLLGDDVGQNLNTVLKRYLASRNLDFKMETVLKPGACFDNIAKDSLSLIKNYNFDDFLLVFGGSNDLFNNRFPSFKILVNMIRECSFTNLLLFSVPYVKSNYELNCKIYRFNSRLMELCYRMNDRCEGLVCFVDLNSDGGARLGNVRLSDKIFNVLSFPFPIRKNLIFIKPVELDLSTTSGETGEILSPQSNIVNKQTFLEVPSPKIVDS